MKIRALLLLLVVVLLGACKKDNSTPAEPVEPNYTHFKVLNVKITAMPFLDANGTEWDPFDGPDVYFNVEKADGWILYNGSSSQFKNVVKEELPLSWNLSSAYHLENLITTHYFSVYDYDAVDPNDPIGYIEFTLGDHTAGYPKTITKTSRLLTITLTGEWY